MLVAQTPSAVLLLRAFGEVEPVIFVLAVLFGPKLCVAGSLPRRVFNALTLARALGRSCRYYIRKNKQHNDSLRGGGGGRGNGAAREKLIKAETEVVRARGSSVASRAMACLRVCNMRRKASALCPSTTHAGTNTPPHMHSQRARPDPARLSSRKRIVS